MIYCPKCGEENSEDALYCRNCRFSLALVSRYVASPDSIDSSTITFRKGYSLGKRYQILEELGRGGMGIVYKAKDLMLNDYVALKLLLPQLTTDAEILDRFKREVLAARKIGHPNVIKVYDIGETNNITFISMEFLVGTDLKKKIKVKGALTVEESINIIKQICSGLEAAHQTGIIHRDIKPQNIFMTKKNLVKLMDFGIARAGDMTGLTTAGTLVGTPEYMSPEQADPKKTVDSRTDIYSLGIVMYEMFCGRVPFRADTPIETVIKHLMEEPEPLRFVNPKISPAIDYIVMKSLQKNPDERYQRARDISSDFDKKVLKRTETIDLRKPKVIPSLKVKEPPPAKKIPIKEATVVLPEKKGVSKALIGVFSIAFIAVVAFLLYILLKPPVVPERQPESRPVKVAPEKPGEEKKIKETQPKGEVVKPPGKVGKQEQLIASLRQKAQAAFNRGQFTSPSGNNALKFANDILAIDPENKFALDLKSSIAGKYRSLAEQRLKAGNWSEARANYILLLKVIPNDKEALSRIDEIGNRIRERQSAQQLKAREADDFNAARRADTIEAWRSFLQRYSTSKQRSFVLRRIDSLEKEKRSFDQAKRENTLEAWNRFLTQYPNSRYARQAKQGIQNLQTQPGWVVISAYPLAEAYLDGQKLGNTPPVIKRQVKPGKHLVVLEIKDYEKYTKEVTVSPNKEITVHYVFKPFGTLVVNSIPWAHISVDGVDHGTTPLTIKKIAEGEHKVVLSREGFNTLTKVVNIKARETTRQVLNLEKE